MALNFRWRPHVGNDLKNICKQINEEKVHLPGED